jgi:hypothetical protein
MPRSAVARLTTLLALGAAAAAPRPAPLTAQDGVPGARDEGGAGRKPARLAPIYGAEAPLAMTFTANFRRLRGDKGEKVPWRAATLAYAAPAGDTVVVPLRARTRGFWRLKSCAFPPLRLDFAGKAVRNTALEHVDRPKLVSHCRNDDRYDQYVLQELQLYRIYRLLTPFSHNARLLRVTYVDSASGKTETTRYALMVEEEQALARRVNGTVVKEQGAGPDALQPRHAALFGVFQYLIGNTDWSIYALHNAELVRDSIFEIVPVPYDFDFAGAVNATYATVDPKLPIKNVRERIYRGYCVPPEDLAAVLALFRERREAIYALYRDDVGKLLEPRVVEATLAYFDAFYRTLDDPRATRRQIAESCIGFG